MSLYNWVDSYLWSLRDPVPGALLLPLQLPNICGFFFTAFDANQNWQDMTGIGGTTTLAETGSVNITCETVATNSGLFLPYVELDGTNDVFTAGADTARWDFAAADFTILAVVWPDTATLGTRIEGIVNKWLTTGDLRQYTLYIAADGTATFEVSANGTAANSYSVASAALTADSWHFIAARWTSGGQIEIKVNNAAWVTTTAALAGPFDTARALRIGGYNEDATKRLDGRISYIALIRQALGDDIINWVYACQAPYLGTSFA